MPARETTVSASGERRIDDITMLVVSVSDYSFVDMPNDQPRTEPQANPIGVKPQRLTILKEKIFGALQIPVGIQFDEAPGLASGYGPTCFCRGKVDDRDPLL